PSPLEIRFRRGDEWQLGRLKSLTREGMHVVTTAPPRVGDAIDISVGDSLSLRGEVMHATRAQAAAEVGGSGFSVRFVLRHAEERQGLEALLRAEGVAAVRAAPSRREARYPVRWPLTVSHGERTQATAALDVSASGMFVGGDDLPDRDVGLMFMIDDAEGP